MAAGYQPGQRWVSETEPELGLGSILQVTGRTVTVSFTATAQTRQYALENAPLRRVRFQAGDRIRRQDGAEFRVARLREQDGRFIYDTEEGSIPESELSDQVSFSKPDDRFLLGQLDSIETFELRRNARQHEFERRKSAVRGFVGGRIELIPHQLYIAAEVSDRLAPRVLLADEVGLGKTIEACLILHRLIQTRRVERVLILVPEPLLHQWFVELLRRFQLWFQILDEERWATLEAGETGLNPFQEEQWFIAGMEAVARHPRRQEQALAAGWDILVVDEAHHLGWSPDAVSPEYELVEKLAGRIPSVLLLTATPEQLGQASHFARLRLLDPNRYIDLEAFLRESEHYREIARVAGKLLGKDPLAPEEAAHLQHFLRLPAEEWTRRWRDAEAGVADARQRLVDDLLDRHGPGRVMFRNTRSTISGFPERIIHLAPLSPPHNEELLDRLAAEFASDLAPHGTAQFEPQLAADPRIGWLSDLLRSLVPEKILLICRTAVKAQAIATALAQRLRVKTALFHEGLPLIQRDRNAAWFAEEDGAQILIASEIGSEGRNFQFAHHLVLFDLPLDPEWVEQRIGRLDRIGQKSEVHIHVPWVRGSSQEVLVRWFHEGLNSLAHNLRGGHRVLEWFGPRVQDLAQDFHETQDTSRSGLEALLHETRLAVEQLRIELEQGRDRLLELNSFRRDTADQIIRAIRRLDQSDRLDQFMISVFDHYGIHLEELAKRSYFLGSAGVFADTFPGLPAEGFSATTERSRALSREDVQFLTWDHPLVTGALDLILGSELGNSCYAHWPDRAEQAWYLEALYVAEVVAPAPLHVDRFLPPTPVRVLVDQQGLNETDTLPAERLRPLLRKETPPALLESSEFRQQMLRVLLDQAEAFAQETLGRIVAQSRRAMGEQLGREIDRLEHLHRVNPNVSARELHSLQDQRAALNAHLAGARLRLDAVCLIRRGPPTVPARRV